MGRASHRRAPGGIAEADHRSLTPGGARGRSTEEISEDAREGGKDGRHGANQSEPALATQRCGTNSRALPARLPGREVLRPRHHAVGCPPVLDTCTRREASGGVIFFASPESLPSSVLSPSGRPEPLPCRPRDTPTTTSCSPSRFAAAGSDAGPLFYTVGTTPGGTPSVAAMGRRGVVVYSRPFIPHPPGESDGTQHSFLTGEEKGIDSARGSRSPTAANTTWRSFTDQDLSDGRGDPGNRSLKIASAFPHSPAARNRRGINKPTGSASSRNDSTTRPRLGTTASARCRPPVQTVTPARLPASGHPVRPVRVGMVRSRIHLSFASKLCCEQMQRFNHGSIRHIRTMRRHGQWRASRSVISMTT